MQRRLKCDWLRISPWLMIIRPLCKRARSRYRTGNITRHRMANSLAMHFDHTCCVQPIHIPFPKQRETVRRFLSTAQRNLEGLVITMCYVNIFQAPAPRISCSPVEFRILFSASVQTVDSSLHFPAIRCCSTKEHAQDEVALSSRSQITVPLGSEILL